MKKLKGSKAYKETKQTQASTLTSYIEPWENLACSGWMHGRRGKERIYLTKEETEESSKVVPWVLIFKQNSKYFLFSSMTLFSLLTFIKQILNYLCGLHLWFTLYFSQTMLVWTWRAIFLFAFICWFVKGMWDIFHCHFSSQLFWTEMKTSEFSTAFNEN